MKITGNLANYKGMFEAFNKFYVEVECYKNEATCPMIYTIRQHWVIARNWLIKTEWNNRWKIHPNPDVAKKLKSRGELLINYYRLCERCHAMQDNTGIKAPYENAGVWFAKIFHELMGMQIDLAINAPKVWNGNIKKSFLDVERNKSRLLRTGYNPFDKEQGLKALIDIAISLQSQSTIFKRDYWKPYLKSYSAHITEMSSPDWGRCFVRKDKYVIQCGRGKGGNGAKVLGEISYYKNKFFRPFVE